MKLHDILIEGQMKELQMIIKGAEEKAFNKASPTGPVHGDDILKYAIRSLKDMGFDKDKEAAAAKIITDHISKEHGGK